MTPTVLYNSVYAGSPVPVDDNEALDLAAHLIQHPHDTFCVRVSGDSMKDAGIFDGDILIVDRAAHAQPNDVVVAQTDEGFTVKRLSRERGRLRLVSANPEHGPVKPNEGVRICGVATFAIHKL